MPEPYEQHVTSLSGGASDKALLYISLTGFFLVGIAMYRLFLASGAGNGDLDEDELYKRDYDEDLDEADVRKLNRAQRRLRAKNRMKKKRRIEPARGAAVPEDGNNVVGDNNADGAIADHEGLEEVANLSRKERQKLAKAEEKEERRRYVLEREAALKRQEQEETYLERKERSRAEEEERFMAEKERNERDWKEYDEFWTMFKIGGGSGEAVLVKDFVAFMERNKVVAVDYIADQYGLCRDIVIKRIKVIEEEGHINGVYDDQGQFIHLTTDEMAEVADIVRREGRITLEKLACEFSRLQQMKIGDFRSE
mmetsp:Transcript_29495/g.42825  ORF Transcript_29495/g.42825 Transcript_29495/m.42825 type:complete len:310 (+) Transcript_29495:59-988(+)